MKIAHIISSCSAGGAEIFSKSLVLALKNKEGSQVELWVMSRMQDIDPGNEKREKFEKDFQRTLEEKGIPVRFVGKRPKKDIFSSLKKIENLFKDFKPDLVHCHLESVTFHTCRAIGKYKVPIVQTIHSTELKYPLIQRFFLKKKISAYVAISDKVKIIIKNKIKVNDDNIYLIYNGVDLNQFNNSSRTIQETVTKIVSIGRFTQAKDHLNLLESFKILTSKLIRNNVEIPRLQLVGDGELRNEIVGKVNKLELINHVDFLGIRNDIPQILKDSDIYVMSSEWEGLSISLIEALASKIPIVATDAGSNREIINNDFNGKIVPIKNPNALAEAIYELIINKKIREYFRTNSANDLNKFGIEKCANNHFQAYLKILE